MWLGCKETPKKPGYSCSPAASTSSRGTQMAAPQYPAGTGRGAKWRAGRGGYGFICARARRLASDASPL